ncbi:MAG: bifunctional ornithine acetyltransferase/N-acetylglutamate synthase [Eubacteriaceae bacterium]|nr:bifunctional ornithine acetyltransferase/N-acetylglutamate synthase [Eubacteriaceae bacterium]
MKLISGNVCAPQGFKAGGIHCGIRRNKTKKDLGLIVSENRANTACTYTLNRIKASPLKITKNHVSDGYAQAIIVNSGNANSCNIDGDEKAIAMARLAAKTLNISPQDVIVASTGVIGEILPIKPIEDSLPALNDMLNDTDGMDAAYAIMTTDTRPKEIAVEFVIDNKVCRMGAIAKGSGMIHPNMGTMFGFITTDTAINTSMLAKALKETVDDTFNMISIDGDTSTNDMVCLLANGKAGNKIIDNTGENYDIFVNALRYISEYLSKEIARDGEGASKLIICNAINSSSIADAKKIAKSIITSSLFKAAMFGADANWGRIFCAAGYSGADFDPDKVDISLSSKSGSVDVCKNGLGLKFDEEQAKNILLEDEITVVINLNEGKYNATAWGCDLTYDYVKINGDYRT